LAEVAELAPTAQVLRAHDPDRFRTTLFARASARDALTALYAFDCEIGRVRHVVSQPMAGLIRLQWWRDALGAIAVDRPLQHPVVEAMHATWPALAPHEAVLLGAIDAREVELEPEPFDAPSDLEGHLERVAGAIGRTAASVLGAPEASRAAGLVACAWATVRLINEIEADRRQGRVMLPVRLLKERAGLPAGSAARDDDEATRTVVRRLAGLARDMLHRARQDARRPGQALPALLLAVPTERALGKLARASYEHRVAAPERSALAPLHLLLAHARGRF
jgi:phytoene/squalene synthetase